MKTASAFGRIHGFFQFLRHKLPVDVVFQKRKSIEIRIERETAKIDEKSKIFTFLVFLELFQSF